MELGPRDRLSQAFVHEVEKGRTTDSPYGPIVHLDLRHLGAKLIDTKLPFVRELCLKYERIDPVHELIPVRPVVHYMMGGVHTDIDGATPLAGLYAAGETACVSINGANRLGSNSLPECLVFGARAGRAAAEYAAAAGRTPAVVEAQAADEVRRLERDLLGKGAGTRASPTIRDEMQTTMEDAAGIYRTGPTWPRARTPSRAAGAGRERRRRGHQPVVQHRAARGPRAGQHARHRRVHPPVRPAARGVPRRAPAHRLPGPRRRTFLTHQLVHRNPDGTPRVERLPVTITRWPPGERVYGR